MESSLLCIVLCEAHFLWYNELLYLQSIVNPQPLWASQLRWCSRQQDSSLGSGTNINTFKRFTFMSVNVIICSQLEHVSRPAGLSGAALHPGTAAACGLQIRSWAGLRWQPAGHAGTTETHSTIDSTQWDTTGTAVFYGTYNVLHVTYLLAWSILTSRTVSHFSNNDSHSSQASSYCMSSFRLYRFVFLWL